jgi:hypothetical protein
MDVPVRCSRKSTPGAMPNGSAWACLQPCSVRGSDDRSRRSSPIACTSHIRSLDRNGRRQKQENVNAWACPASLNRRHAFRCSSIARQDSRSVAASSAATTFCRNSEDMPTQSRWAWHPACRGESCRVHDLSPGNEQETICSYERSAVKKKLLPFRRVPCPTARRGHVFNPAVSEAATTGPGKAVRCQAVRVPGHSTRAKPSAYRTILCEPDWRGSSQSRPKLIWVRSGCDRSRRPVARTDNERDRPVADLPSATKSSEPTLARVRPT